MNKQEEQMKEEAEYDLWLDSIDYYALTRGR